MRYIKRPLVKAFGSKWALAKRYPAPKYDLIAEPFAFSASYSLWHVKPGMAFMWNDTNADLMQCWDWLLKIPRTSRELRLRASREERNDGGSLDQRNLKGNSNEYF